MFKPNSAMMESILDFKVVNFKFTLVILALNAASVELAFGEGIAFWLLAFSLVAVLGSHCNKRFNRCKAIDSCHFFSVS